MCVYVFVKVHREGILRVCASGVVLARACDIASDALQRLPITGLAMPHSIAGNKASPSKNTVTFLPSAYREQCDYVAAVLGILNINRCIM